MIIARLLLCLLVLTGLAAKAQAVTDAQTIFNEATAQVYTETDKALKSADYLLQNAADNDDKANALWLQSEIYSLKGQYLKAVDLLFEAKAVAEKKDIKAKILAAIAIQCEFAGLTDKAKSYTEEASKISKTPLKSMLNPNFAIALNADGYKNLPTEAINNILEALPKVQKSQDVQLKAIVYKNLADSYFTLNDTENYKAYNQQFDTLNDLLNDQKDKARIALLSHIDKDYEALQAAQSKDYATIIYVCGSTFLLLSFIGFIYILGQRKDYRQYQKILAGLETPEAVKPIEAIIPETKVYSMPEKTEKGLLEKLARFEESGKFINNNISLNGLAKQLDTNTKYLSEIINTHKGGNFNAYINELRVKYILKKLQSDPVYLNYKVSYLAKESGFSSHSAFATVFKAVTGISPTTYISFLKKETENVLNQQPVNSHAS